MRIGSAVRASARPIGCAVLAAAIFATGGCQSGYIDAMAQCTRAYKAGNYSAASQICAIRAVEDGMDDRDAVVECVDAGRTAQTAGDYTASAKFFDEAYEKVRPYLDEKSETKILEQVTSTLVNDTVAEYYGTPPERIFLNTFQAINKLAVGDLDGARIELRRAQDWQQDAVAKNAKRIEAAQAAAESKAKQDGVDVNAATSSPGVAAELDKFYGRVREMKPYADYVNPFTLYVQGAFFLSSGDRADRDSARQCFDRLRQMVSGPAVATTEADFAAADSGATGGALPPTTWVFLLDGLAPTRDQFRLPIPISLSEPLIVTVAFPYLVMRDDTVGGLTVRGGAETKSALIADVDGMVGADFSQQLPGIITRQIIGAVAKAVATKTLKDNAGSAGHIAGLLYQLGTMSADVRIWQTLPKHVHVARLPTPESGTLQLQTGAGRDLGAVAVRPGDCNMVFVTCPSPAAAPSIISVSLRPGATPAAAAAPAATPEATPAAAPGGVN